MQIHSLSEIDRLGDEKVRALTRVATPETEARLLAVGRAGTAAHVERIVRSWRCVDRRAEARETARRHTNRALHVYQDEDGMTILRGRLEPEVGALLIQALAAARETLYQRARVPDRAAGHGNVSEEMPSLAQRQADALALLAETALHHGLDPGERYQVVVHVDAPCWPIRSSRGSRSSRTACAFLQKRPSAWPATPAGW